MFLRNFYIHNRTDLNKFYISTFTNRPKLNSNVSLSTLSLFYIVINYKTTFKRRTLIIPKSWFHPFNLNSWREGELFFAQFIVLHTYNKVPLKWKYSGSSAHGTRNGEANNNSICLEYDNRPVARRNTKIFSCNRNFESSAKMESWRIQGMKS